LKKNKRIKIGIDARPMVEENKDGISLYTQNLIDEMIKDDSIDFVLYFNKKQANINQSNVSNRILNGINIAWPQIRLSLDFIINRPKLDLFLSPAHSVPLYCPFKSIAVIHDLAYFKFREYFTKFDYFMLSKLTTNIAIKNASHLIAVSKSTKNDIVKYFDIPSKKISIVYQGFNSKIYYPQNLQEINDIKIKYGIKNNYIIYVGTLQKRKNIVRLIKAFERMKKNDKISDNLVIVGKCGWLYDEIFEIVKKLNLDKEVIFTDYVPLNDLPTLISGAKFYILPSLYEGFGIPILEAMACKVPVIVSNTSSMPEVCQNAGLLINNPYSVEEIYQKMKRLYFDNNLRNRLSKKGLKRARDFSWEKCAQETINIIKKTIYENA